MVVFPLLDRFNTSQRMAITAEEGHLCINAAAGTGKTSTIAGRILYLQLEKGVAPQSILAVSFSRAARANLLERVEEYINLLGRGANVNTLTLHGLAFRVLRLAVQHGETWLRPGFKVIAGSRNGVNRLFEEYGERLVGGLHDQYSLEDRLEIYSSALNLVRQGHPALDRAVLEPEELDEIRSESIMVNWDQGSRSPVVLGQLQRVWKSYDKLLRSRNAIDYAGMLSEGLRVLYREGRAFEDFQHGLRYIIVDEYQDTSRAQEEMIGLLAGNRISINVVGDSNQAIYTFNGSDPSNIIGFDKKMAGGGLPVMPRIDLTWNYRSASNIIAAANRVLSHGDKVSCKLEPAREGVSEVVAQFQTRNQPVVRVHARELSTAASWTANEVRRLITEDGVKPQEIAVLVRKDSAHSPHGEAVRKALTAIGLNAQVQDRDPERTARVLEVVYTFLNEQIGESLDDLIHRIRGHECEIEGITTEEALGVLGEAKRAGAESALEAADMVYDMGAPEQTEPDVSGVQVRTVHSAKGLEFRVVFLMYLGDREFPSGSRPDLPEERRLYYVGITRAMERLYVLGRRGVAFPSFFDEIDGDGVQLVEAVESDRVRVDGGVDDGTRELVESARRRQKQGRRPLEPVR